METLERVVKNWYFNFGKSKINVQIVHLKNSIKGYKIYETRVLLPGNEIIHFDEMGGPQAYKRQLWRKDRIYSFIKKAMRFAQKSGSKLPPVNQKIHGQSMWTFILAGYSNKPFDMELIFDTIGYIAQPYVDSNGIRFAYWRCRKNDSEAKRANGEILWWASSEEGAKNFVKENLFNLIRLTMEHYEAHANNSIEEK